MKIFMILFANLSLFAVANAQSFSKCTITNVSGDIVTVLDYAKGTFIVDTMDLAEMPDFVNALNDVAFVTVNKSTGSISTNSGARSMNSGKAASNHIKEIIENNLGNDYKIKCKESTSESNYWGGNN